MKYFTGIFYIVFGGLMLFYVVLGAKERIADPISGFDGWFIFFTLLCLLGIYLIIKGVTNFEKILEIKEPTPSEVQAPLATNLSHLYIVGTKTILVTLEVFGLGTMLYFLYTRFISEMFSSSNFTSLGYLLLVTACLAALAIVFQLVLLVPSFARSPLASQSKKMLWWAVGVGTFTLVGLPGLMFAILEGGVGKSMAWTILSFLVVALVIALLVFLLRSLYFGILAVRNSIRNDNK